MSKNIRKNIGTEKVERLEKNGKKKKTDKTYPTDKVSEKLNPPDCDIQTKYDRWIYAMTETQKRKNLPKRTNGAGKHNNVLVNRTVGESTKTDGGVRLAIALRIAGLIKKIEYIDVAAIACRSTANSSQIKKHGNFVTLLVALDNRANWVRPKGRFKICETPHVTKNASHGD